MRSKVLRVIHRCCVCFFLFLLILTRGTKPPSFEYQSGEFPIEHPLIQLRQLSAWLADSTGFFLISGLHPGRSSDAQNIISHAGLASHIGDKRAMAGGEGGDKNVLHHITPLPAPVEDENNKYKIYNGPPNQCIAIPFHNDAGEIVSLYMLSLGTRGGRFYLGAASSIYSELQRTRPDLISVLEAPWTIFSPQPDGSSSSETRPLLFHNTSVSRTIKAALVPAPLAHLLVLFSAICRP
jgi:Taurine catabolism dioxygenase TauD, TfdA family